MGLINCKILFRKVISFFELCIDISRLFNPITEEGKKEFLKKLCIK